MTRKTIVAVLPIAVLVALAAAPTALASSEAERAATFKIQSDPSGDSGAAPDITEVQVGNDVVAGPIVMWITTSNRESLGGDDAMIVYLDTDLNSSTGAVDWVGAEYGVEVQADSVFLFRWDGADWAQVAAGSLEAAFFKSEKAVRISIQPSDLGSTRGFNYYVYSVNGDASDFAPDGVPIWSYSLTSGRVALEIVDFALTKAPRAGKRLAAGLQVGRNDTNELLEEGKVTCTLRVGTKTVRAASAGFVEGIAVCAWNLPKSAKGQKVSGTISVTYGGTTIKKAFSARVR